MPDKDDWVELRYFLSRILCAWLSKDFDPLGWQTAEGVVSHAEPICAALNLYHFVILREWAQGTDWTGKHPNRHSRFQGSPWLPHVRWYTVCPCKAFSFCLQSTPSRST